MSAPSSVEALLGLIDAAIYGDVFDCAVTLDELWRYSLVAIERDALAARLAAPPLREVVTECDGLWVLRGREALAERRVRRRAHAEELRRRARAVGRCLQHLPFVRGLLLTGSVAADDADVDADVDMLVIVQPGRLGLAFAVLATLSRVMSREVFCPNYYLSEAHLALGRRDHYVARELMQAEPLTGGAARIFAANDWTGGWLPNATARGDGARPLPFGRALQWLLELPFRGTAGDRLDRRAHDLALRRLAVHHASCGSLPPESVRERFTAGVELRFHGGPVVARANEQYAERRATIGRRIAALTGTS